MRLTKNEIVTELVARGFDVKESDVVKNGVHFPALCINDDIENEKKVSVSPLIYTEPFIENAERHDLTLKQVVDEIVKVYNDNKNVPFNLEEVLSCEFILKFVTIGMQKKSFDDELVKKDCEFDGIETYLYVSFIDNERIVFSMPLKHATLKYAGLEENEVWKVAEKNLYESTVVSNLNDVIMNMVDDMEINDFNMESCRADCPLLVITNKFKSKGASAILNKKVLKEIAEKFNTECVNGEENQLENFSKMVNEVNSAEVEPFERLTNRAYLITV